MRNEIDHVKDGKDFAKSRLERFPKIEAENRWDMIWNVRKTHRVEDCYERLRSLGLRSPIPCITLLAWTEMEMHPSD